METTEAATRDSEGRELIARAYRMTYLSGTVIVALVVGLVCMLYQVTVGVCVLGAGALLVLWYLLRRRAIFEQTRYTMAASLTWFCFLQGSCVVLGLTILVASLPLASAIAAAASYLILLAGYHVVYAKAYDQAWEARRRYNVTEALVVEASLYRASRGFQMADVEWDDALDRLGIYAVRLGPLLIAGGFILERHGLGGLRAALLAGLALVVGVGLAQVTAQLRTHYRKLREIEHEHGILVRNR